MSKRFISAEYNGNDPKFIRHSDEIQDIIMTVPGRLIRWGTFLFFCVFAMIVGLAAFVRFPDMLQTTLKVTDISLGEMSVPQAEIQKVHSGQVVMIKLKSYPFEHYGMVKGSVKSISATLDNAGNLTATVVIDTGSMNKAILLKPGMLADVQIATEDVSILKRIIRNVFHSAHHQ